MCDIDLSNVTMPDNWFCDWNPILHYIWIFREDREIRKLEDLTFVQIIIKQPFFVTRVQPLFGLTHYFVKPKFPLTFNSLTYHTFWNDYSTLKSLTHYKIHIWYLIPTLLAFEKYSSYSRVIITRITQSILFNLWLLANLVNSIIKISIVDLLFLMKIYDSDVFSLDNRLFFRYTLRWINCLIIDLLFYLLVLVQSLKFLIFYSSND